MAISFKGAHFPKEIILMGVHWYLAYPIRTRHAEELMEERGVSVDHAPMNRWVIKYSPQMVRAKLPEPQFSWVYPCRRRKIAETPYWRVIVS